MKSILKYILLFFGVSILMTSCKKDGIMVSAKEGSSGALTSSVSTLILSKDVESDTVINLNWSLSDFGYSAAVTQTLQLAYANTDFVDSVVVTLDPKQTSLSFAGIDFNSLISKLNLPFGTTSLIDVRIKSTISSTFPAAYSNVVTLKVQPYAMTSWLYVPGAYQNWVIESPDSLISATGNNIYTGIINFPATSSEFKLTTAKSWDNAYGDGGSGKLSTSGGNLASPGSGSYQITANLNALTYSMTAFQYGFVGDASVGGWNTDTDMKYNNGDGTWSVTTTLTVGAIKFRLNHAWVDATNYGGSGGILAVNGSDISVTAAGTYKVVLDIPNLKYTLTKQ